MYFWALTSDNVKLLTTLNGVGLGLLLNVGLISSIERTLLPIDSK